MAAVDRVFVVIRFDTEAYATLRPGEAELQFTAIEVFPDEESAMDEVRRLNALNRQKCYRYSLQSARWYPQGRHVGG